MLDMLTHMHKQTSSNSHQQHACRRAGAFQGAVPIFQSPQHNWCMRCARFCILHAHTHAQANLDHPTFAAHLSSSHAKETVLSRSQPSSHLTAFCEWDSSATDEAWYWPKHVLHRGWLCITSRPIFLEGCGSLVVYACTILLVYVTILLHARQLLGYNASCHDSVPSDSVSSID